MNSPERLFVVRVVNGKAEWIDVKKGREANGKIEVFSDKLQAGDQLVKKASEEVRDGAEVKNMKMVAGY